MMNQTIPVDALTRVVHIYLYALADIATEETPNPSLRAIQALQDGAALMEERTDHRP